MTHQESAKVQLKIQSFCEREVQSKERTSKNQISRPGDGFTEVELVNCLDPLSRKWDPVREYEKLVISRLHPGPKAVSFMGKIVNIKTYFGKSTEQPKAKGWHYLIIKDNTAAILMKLYFAITPYTLQLGQFLTFWTAFISEILHDNLKQPISVATISANMFPGRVASDYIRIHHNIDSMNICNRPLGYQSGQELSELVTLDSYLGGGHDDVRGIKVLLVVKNISPSKKVKRKETGEQSELISVGLMDNTAESHITIWNELIASAHKWKPRETVLLITNPGFRSTKSTASQSRGSLQILRSTMIEIDPDIEQAYWLRQWVKRKAQGDAITWNSTEDEWDFEAAQNGVVRIFFTLAELDTWTRSDWIQNFTGFINVVIRGVNLFRLHRLKKLMCGECCGNSIYSNSSALPCETCGNLIYLLPNSNVVGQLLDETGCIDGGCLNWSPNAWEKLFGRPVEAVAAWNEDDCIIFEQRLCFLRVHLCVGWKQQHLNQNEKSNIAKLSILGVHM